MLGISKELIFWGLIWLILMQDDIVVKSCIFQKKIHFKMRSQDVLHSAYMPYFRAQMNCVPGMVTEFAFEPIYTTAEYKNCLTW
jgi:cytochrome c oxidase subunit 2